MAGPLGAADTLIVDLVIRKWPLGIAGVVQPTCTELRHNYPNPFNPSTTIRYSLASAEAVSLVIYNILGQPVKTLVSRPQPVAYHTVVWDGRDDAGRPPASGVYFVRLVAGDVIQTRRMLLLR